MAFRRESQYMLCPECHNRIWTAVEYNATTKTHMVAALLCIFLLWPCICIPYCKESCQNANHYCPNCGTFLGTRHGSFRLINCANSN